MNIAIIMGEAGCVPGIAQRMAQELADRGCHVDVFTRKAIADRYPIDRRSAQYVYPPVWLEWICGTRGVEPGDFIFRTWHFLRKKYDVIHVSPGHRPSIFFPCQLAKVFRKSMLVDEWWEWFGKDGVGRYRKGVVRKLIGLYDSIMEVPAKRFFNRVIAITNTLATRIPNHPSVCVLHGAMDEKLISTVEKSSARDILDLNQNDLIIGMSNVDAWDHPDNSVFFEAMCEVCRATENLKLFITGDDKYIKMVALNGLIPSDRLLSMGWIPFDQYKLFLSACDLFVLPFPDNPRNRGRWPNKFGDYIALQRPILTNDTGDVGLLMKTHRLGFLCRHDKESYIELLLKISRDQSSISPNKFDIRTISKNDV